MLTTGLNLCQGNGALTGVQAAELAAGAQDIATAAATEVDVEMTATEDVLKGFDGGIGWPPVWTARKGVEGNQVDLATNTTQQFDEPGGIFSPVIYVGKEDG